jgi:hypothetical protein
LKELVHEVRVSALLLEAPSEGASP